MGAIFISHSEKDLATVNEIIWCLEQAGYHTWYFERDVLPGTSYLVQIHDAVDQCDAVVLVVSSNSISSDQTTKEVVGAFERRKPFFPILLDMTPPQLKQRQPEWRHALGGTAMICVGPKSVSECAQQVIEGLKVRGILPEKEKIHSVQKAVIAAPGKPLPTSLKDKILSSRSSMEGERRQVTVLFADVSGFTSISEKLDPEEVHQLISEALVPISEEIHRFEGTIVQFLGDGVMALFGAPIAHEDAPQRALHAGLGIQERVREYAAKLKPKGIEFDMHIGLNSGLVIVGRIGDDLTMEYTAMGDTVNLASRLASLAQPGAILVSEYTHRLTEGYFDFQPLGEVEVKGKKQPVKAYELLGIGPAKTRLGVSVARGLTPFVGRRKELGHLWDCYEGAKKGQGQVVGIVGEPGAGKSRLVLQMKEALPPEENVYLEGGCFHYGDAVPYLPLINILRHYFAIEEGEPELSVKEKIKEKIARLDQRLETLLPPLHDILSLKVEDEGYLKLDPPHRREKTFEAIRNLLLRQSQDLPLVLAVEDLHWMDKTSEEFLGQFITSLAHSHIMLILLYRPEYSNPWTSKTYYTQIRVGELSQEASAEMVQAILHEGEATPELKEVILGRAAGNPLFMEELTRSLLDRGFIQQRNGYYVLTVKPSDIQVPETVQAIIRNRIDRLDEKLKPTIQVASVIGRTFTYILLHRVLGEPENLKSQMADLQASEFVYEERVFPELEYIFKHALTQEVAYNSLLIKRRKEIHERIGKAVEEIYSERLEEFYEMLAYHYSCSDNHEKAYQYLRLSSLKVEAKNATAESLRFGREAITALEQMPLTDENKRRGIEMRLLLSGPLTTTGRGSEAERMMQKGARLAEEVGDNRSLADLYGTLGVSRLIQGDPIGGAEFAEKAFWAAERTGEAVLMATNCLELCMASLVMGAFERIARVSPRVLDLLEQAHLEARSDLGKYYNLNLFSTIKACYGLSLGCLGNLEKGLALCKEACRFAEEVGNVYSVAHAEWMCNFLLLAKGDGKGAIEHLDKAVRHAEQAQMFIYLWMAPTPRGQGYYLQGELEAARKDFEKRLELYRSTQYPVFLSLNYYGLGLVCLDSGDIETARGHIEESLRLAKKQGEKTFEGVATFALGRVIGKADSSQGLKAEQLILEGIKLLDELHIKPYQAEGWLYLGELYADTRQNERALATLKKAHGMFQEMGMDYWLARTEKALEKLEAQ